MTKYAKIETNVVTQVQPNSATGFHEVHEDVICGMIYSGTNTNAQRLDISNYSVPAPEVTWSDIKTLQREFLGANTEVMWRIARYKSQEDLTGVTPTESAAKYQELLQYCQDVRDADEDTYATPQQALDALNALVVPSQV